MKFRWKVFLLCLGVYLVTLLVTGVTITEKTYSSSLDKEIERSLSEQDNLYFTLSLFLLSNQDKEEDLQLEDHSKKIFEFLAPNRTYLEIYNRDLDLLVANTKANWPFSREELKKALEGKRNYVLRWKEQQHYLFITDLVELKQESYIVVLIKNINFLDQQKKEMYFFFFQAGLFGFLVVAVVTGVMGKIILKPIDSLTETAKDIAAGNYEQRVKSCSKDELGLLAEQFNRMAEEVETRISLLKEEGERKQRFIDNLTHELRTPLTSVLGYAELLLKIKYEEETFRKGLNYIYAEGKRMLNLINSLMDLILLRENLVRLKLQPVWPVLKEVEEIMKFKAVEKGINLIIRGEDLELALDKDLFKAALINLVDNALKASEVGSLVSLGIEKENDQISIYVNDEGKGMEPEQVQKILEPFYRVDKSRSRQEGGIGLGLTICQEIIKIHRGKLLIESQPRKGTTVKIIFQFTT